MAEKKILIVEDDRGLNQGITLALHAPEYRFYSAHNLKEARRIWKEERVSLIILDINLPDGSGYTFLEEIRRESEVPVIMLTANDLEIDQVTGFSLGADDYITKPFSPNELVARVKAHLNRYIRLTRKRSDENEYIEYPGLKIDRTARRVFVDGEERCFTTKEFDLLTYLATHPNHVFSKDELFSAVWGMDSMGEIATVTVHIKKIRKKTENSNVKTGYIETVWGAGYRFRVLNGKVDEEKESVINAI